MGVTAGIVEFADFDNAEQERPHLVRLRKADLSKKARKLAMVCLESMSAKLRT